MAQRGSGPSALRWLIGVELAHYRNRATLTLAELAVPTGISKQKLGHLETAERRQYPTDITKVLTACGAAQHDIDRLTTLAGMTDSTTWWGPWSDVVPDWLGTFVGLERLATNEFIFGPITLPGLMQTPEYARELTYAALRVRRDHAERTIEFRMERARRLTDGETPLHLHTVVTEQALRLNVGTSDVMAAQYDYLIELADRPNVTLQVVTPERGPHGAVNGQFVLLDFEIARSIGYVELQDGAIYVQHAGAVDTYQESARSLKTVALPPDESVGFIADLRKRL